MKHPLHLRADQVGKVYLVLSQFRPISPKSKQQRERAPPIGGMVALENFPETTVQPPLLCSML